MESSDATETSMGLEYEVSSRPQDQKQGTASSEWLHDLTQSLESLQHFQQPSREEPAMEVAARYEVGRAIQDVWQLIASFS